MGRVPPGPEGPPPLPFLPGEVSNGEFIPRPLTAHDRAVIAETLARAADAADRLGMDRRRFLQSAAGMAAMLGTVNLAACASGGADRRAAGPSTSTAARPSTTGGPGGTYEVPDARGRRGVRAGAGRPGRVHLRRPHPPRHAGRSLAPERAPHRRHDPRTGAGRLRRGRSVRRASTGSPTCTTCSSPATRRWRCCPTCPTRAPTTRPCRSPTPSARTTSPIG